MRYEDASHTGAFAQGSEPDARNDADAIAAGSKNPATGNVITGEGTQTGPSGADYAPGAHITSIAGAGGEDSSFAGGKLAVSGEFGRLSIDAEGNYSYQPKPSVPENSVDRFTYTLADSQGGADTATLTVEIGKTPAVIKANAQQVVPGPDGVVILPPGVELSDVHIVGRNLVIDLPDGGQMVIIDGAVFVPQLVLGGVEVPATNLAALLVGQEIAPAAGEGPPQSSGGNFEVPVGPLDPGVPLGDLIPPTEYTYIPPEVREVFDVVDEEPEVFVQPDGQPATVAAVDSVDEKGLPERNEGEPEGSGEEAAAGADGDPSEATGGMIVVDSPDGVDSLTIAGSDGIEHEIVVGLQVQGDYGTLTITGIVGSNYTYSYVLDDNIDHSDGQPDEDVFNVVLTDNDGDQATASLTIDIIDDVPTARPDTDFIAAEEFGPVTGNVITDDDAGDHDVSGTDSDTDNGRDTVGADDASLTNVTGVSTQAVEGGWIVQGQYGVLTINDDGSYSYLRNADSPGGVSDVFNYVLTDGDGDTSASTLTITIEDATPRLATPAAAQLDDDVFTGGNPGGTDDANPDTANLSGNLAGAGGDGDLDYAFTGTNTLPAGFSVDPTSTATELKILQGGTLVLTITLNTETGAYTVTQNAPMDHPTPGISEEDLSFLIGVKVIDADGDSAVSTLTINVDDDTPLAFNDSDTLSGNTAVGNVITGVGTTEGAANADKPGADGFDTITALSGSGGSDSDATGGFSAPGTYGSLQMDASGNYTYTRAADTPGGVSESFTYTYRDGDGDLASATLTINIPDATPQLGTPAIAQLDDDVFTGGNPGGTDDANPDTANLSGSLAGTGGDGDLDYAFTGTNNLPAGFSVDPTSTATTLKILQGGTLVLTITLDTETGAYTVAQNAPMDHPTPGISEEDLTFGIGVKVVDVDGDSAVNTLTIKVDDDTPLAFNDSDNIAGGGTTASGNVITGAGTNEGTGNADKPGADGYDTITNLAGSGSSDGNPLGGFTAIGSYGTLQMDANGGYTYTRADGSPGDVTDTFTYTYRDGDGDLASATLTINIGDAAPLLGTPLIAQLDDETFTGGNPGGTDDANPNTANLTGNLAGSGGDGDLDYAFTGTNSLPTGFSIDPTSTATTLKILQGGTLVMTVTLNLDTGAYTVTQNAPMDHPTPGISEEDLTFGIGVKVIDEDGDSAINTLTIKVDDDTPLAFNDTDTVSAGTATGNVITGVGTTEGTGNADKPGADGYDTITQLQGSGGTDSDASGGFTAPGTYGTLQMAADGSYTYTRAAGTPGGVSESFTYTYKDGDGDLASATLTISIPDATPSLPTPPTVLKDDDALSGGNAGGTDDDANSAGTPGTLAGTGGDGDLDYAFTGTNTLPAGFSASVNPAGTVLTISQAGVGVVLTVTLDLETGDYSVVQNLPIVHPTPGVSEENLTFGVGVKVVDVDGDSATNTLTINVDDDTPTMSIESPLQIDNDATPTATGDFAISVGADKNADFDDINLSNFSVRVNGELLPVSDFSITPGTENATSAIYTFEFDYDTGNGGTATATGTMEFFKSGPNVGTYTVTLDEPLEGFSTLQTAHGEAFVGYEFDSTTPDNTQPAVAVTTIKSESSPGAGDGFYVQFTGFTAGNGDHETLNPPFPDATADGSWAPGDLFSEGTSLHQSWVSVSNDSNGVGGDTVNGPDAINFNLYSSDPKGDFNTQAGNLPTASASDMFLRFDGVAAGDDFIVVLKLWEDTDGIEGISAGDTFTTKAIVVEAGDMYLFGGSGSGSQEGDSVAALAGTPYEDVVAEIVADGGSNNNDGLVIIESNDYNGVGENWSIVGAQIINTSSNVSGSGINLDPDVGDTGGSGDDGTVNFNTVTDGAPMKITNIGFIAGTSNDQNATLEFDLTVTDNDGDSTTITDVTVNIGDTTSNTLLAPATTMAVSSQPAHDTSSFSSLLASDSQQVEKTAANSNTTLLAAAVAASGFVGTQAAASPGNSDFGHQHQMADSSNFASKMGSLAVNSADDSRSMLSNETKVAANDEVQTLSSSHGSADNAQSAHGLDNAAAHMPAELSAFFAAGDQGPGAQAAAGPVAPAVAMVSAEALQAAGLEGNVQHGGSVAKVIADALGQGAAPTVDGLLQAVGNGHGDNGLAAISHVASPAADAVPAWDMGTAGAFVPGADMMFKMGAEMLHHDAVQPVVNG